ETQTSAPHSLARSARSSGVGFSSWYRRRVASAPRRVSSSARATARPNAASASEVPLVPVAPGSPGPWPGSMATRAPSRLAFSRLTASRSRTAAPETVPSGWSGWATRTRSWTVSGPTIPSARIPTFRWNSRTARSQRSPKMPSSRPASNPSAVSRRCTSRTSSPRSPAEMVLTAEVSGWPAVSRNRSDAAGAKPGGPLVPSGREVRLDLAQDGVLAPGPHHASLLLPVLEHDQGGDRHHAVPAGGLGVVVHVHLAHRQGSGLVPGQPLDNRRHHVAGHTPFCPEVDQHRLVRLDDLLIEVLVRHVT